MSKLTEQFGPESLVAKAHAFAEEAHRGQTRASGEPYFTHCEAVAETVAEWHLDEASVAAALLHDVVEDTAFTAKDIEDLFGAEVAFLVQGLTKLQAFEYDVTDEHREVENLRKFIVSFARDLRVVIVKLADRLHNMRTLKHLSPERQHRMAVETSDIYAPLAYRLGMQKLSGELEDLAFPFIHPEAHAWLLKAVRDSYEARMKYAERVKPMLLRALAEHGIRPLKVDSRAKRYSSLYKKLLRYDMDVDRIHDLVAIRIIVKSIEECYATLGAVHGLWQPMPGRVKDYIARPKPNGYRSIHTTIFCLDNKITEIQIRTEEMHEEGEMGIAAHWAYQTARDKKGYVERNWSGVQNREELHWVRQLSDWQQNYTDKDKFVQSLKTEFFKDRIFVMTPESDIIDLPKGATPVDFAYRIHSEIGDQCTGARVNQKIVPIDQELHSGDLVEIVTQKGKKPSEDWLRFVKTPLARGHIKTSLRANERALRKKAGPQHAEFKIVGQARQGFMKDVTDVFADFKVFIGSINGNSDNRRMFSIVSIKCDAMPDAKAEKIVVRLRAIDGAREVTLRQE